MTSEELHALLQRAEKEIEHADKCIPPFTRLATLLRELVAAIASLEAELQDAIDATTTDCELKTQAAAAESRALQLEKERDRLIREHQKEMEEGGA